MFKKLLFRFQHKLYIYLYKKAYPSRTDIRLYCRFCKKTLLNIYGQKKGDISNAWQTERVCKRTTYPYPHSIVVNKCCNRSGKPIIREIKVK